MNVSEDPYSWWTHKFPRSTKIRLNNPRREEGRWNNASLTLIESGSDANANVAFLCLNVGFFTFTKGELLQCVAAPFTQ